MSKESVMHVKRDLYHISKETYHIYQKRPTAISDAGGDVKTVSIGCQKRPITCQKIRTYQKRPTVTSVLGCQQAIVVGRF
jgi:hypothetical protein